MSIVINIILILASIVLIIAVLMQEGNKQGLGAIGGAAETFMGKNKAKSAEGKLLMITRIVAAVFVVLAILATWYNSRTYAVTFYNEDGSVYSSESAPSGTALTISDFATPTKAGYSGQWVLAEEKNGQIVKKEGELPTKVGHSAIKLLAEYTVESHTITVVDATGENDDAEAFTYTGDFGTTIDYSAYTAPADKDGYQVIYSTDSDADDEAILRVETLPETVPSADTTYYAIYASGNYIEYYVDEADSENEGEVKQVEYYPWAVSDAYNTQRMYAYGLSTTYATYSEVVEGIDDTNADFYRLFVKAGTDLSGSEVNITVPESDAHEGEVGEWTTEDGEFLSGEMGSERVKVYAKYFPAVNVTFEEEAPADAAEDYEAYSETITDREGAEIAEAQFPSKDGYNVEWIDDEVTVFPASDITVKFRFVEAPAETDEDEEVESGASANESDETNGNEVETSESNEDEVEATDGQEADTSSESGNNEEN